MIHSLKTWPEFYFAVETGQKTFEIRVNDRKYKLGDVLILREYDPDLEKYSGKTQVFRVGYITDFEQRPAFVVMSLAPWVPLSQQEMKQVRDAV